MATETVTVTLSSSVYTALSSGQANVTAFIQRGQSAKFHVAETLPSAGTADFILVNGPTGSDKSNEEFVATGLSATEEVYAMLASGDTSLVVIRS